MSRILYLHGFASGPASRKARFFRDYLESRGAQVEVPDLAEGGFEHLTITGQLDVITRTASGGAVSLIGSSMGGYLASLYAARHAEVERLVLLAPAFGFARRWPERIGSERMAEWRRTGTIEVFHYAENRMRTLGLDLMEDGLRYEDYPDFRQPALIFHGSEDDTVPADYSREFAARHQNARLEIVHSGHELTNVLEYLAPKIADFLLPSD
jgi:pimeloyl-ACP methyl ester carboxylesterase